MTNLLKISLVIFFSLTSSWALAKEKNTSKNTSVEAIVWMDGQQVMDLLTDGAYWCMEPERDTCTFYSQVTQTEGMNVSYKVVSLWTKSIIVEETIDAKVAPDGILCEENTLNLKRTFFTDLSGNPVDSTTLENSRNDWRARFEESKDLDICFAYTHSGNDDPKIITQYYRNASGEFVDPIPFFVDYSPNAENNYLLRWEE